MQTSFFGEVEYEPGDLLAFPKGLFGFEDEHAFLPLSFDEEGTLYSLQSVKSGSLSFTLMHPFSLAPDYAPALHEEELKALGVEKSEDLYYYVMCTVRDPIAESTVNMKCPLAVNPDTHTGLQVILDGDRWGMRQKLADFSRQEAVTC